MIPADNVLIYVRPEICGVVQGSFYSFWKSMQSIYCLALCVDCCFFFFFLLSILDEIKVQSNSWQKLPKDSYRAIWHLVLYAVSLRNPGNRGLLGWNCAAQCPALACGMCRAPLWSSPEDQDMINDWTRCSTWRAGYINPIPTQESAPLHGNGDPTLLTVP